MNDSFELALSNPLTQEDWDKLTDVELENTQEIWFETPSGKRKEFVPMSVIEDIKAEFRQIDATYAYKYFGLNEIIGIIDRHIGEEGNNDKC